MRAAIALACALIAAPACAVEGYTLTLHVGTKHIAVPEGAELHSGNLGVGLRIDTGVFKGLTAGVYRNSNAQTSTYIAQTWQTEDERLALTVGIVTGYANSKVQALVAPSIRVPLPEFAGKGAVRFSYIPRPMKKNAAQGVHLSIERSF